jgi:hypothetical protein
MPGEDWTIRSIDEIKETEVSSIAIGPFGSRMKADLYTSTGVPVIRGTARTLTMRCSRLRHTSITLNPMVRSLDL